MKNPRQKKSEMTLDALAMLTKKGFDEIRGEMNQGFDEIRGEMNQGFDEIRGEMNETRDELRGEMNEMKNELRNEFLTGSDKIIGELQVMREENAAGFGLYKELEKRVFTLEQIVKRMQGKMGMA